MAAYEELAKLLHPSEMAALWNWHHDAELMAAGKGDYDDAKWHRQRRWLFYREPNTPP